MIVRTGAPASFEASIPVRRFTFRVGEGHPEQLLDGPRLATLVKATSSLSIIDVDGIRIVLDGPVGGRPGKQLIIQVREEESGLKLEVRPRPALQASGAEADSKPVVPLIPNQAIANPQAASPSPALGQPEAQHSNVLFNHPPDSRSLSRSATPSGAAPTAIAISEAIEGSTRTTLLGIVGGESLPLRSGEMLPVQVILARPGRTVFSMRGGHFEAEAGGFPYGKIYWAEVVSGAPHAVIRIQSSADAAALQAIAASQPSFTSPAQLPSSQTGADAAAVLFPADFPSGTNLVARVLSRLPSGEYLLDVGGRQLAAPLPQELQAGEEVLLRIEQSQQGAHQVRVLERLRNLIHRSPARLPMADSLGLLSRQLKALLERGQESQILRRLAGKVEGMIGQDAPPSTRRVASLIEEGGLQYESKLARIILENRPQSLGPLLQNDLKALLLRAQSEIRSQPTPPENWRGLAESVDRHLNRIEALQTANLAAQSHFAPFQIEIPFLSGGHLSTVDLFIQPDGGQSDPTAERSKEGFNILFLLDLKGLGRIRVDAHLSGQSLSALISVQHSAALKRLKALLPRLQESLEQAGFRQAQIGARLLEQRQPEADGPQGLSDSQGAEPASLNLIDVVA